MLTCLIHIFIKKKKEYKDAGVRKAYGMLCGCVGIFLNLCLFVGKYAVGFFSGSIAVMADGFNNLSDAASSLLTLIGFQLAGQKPDEEHPFGHGRFEYISALVVAIAIISMAVELFKSSVRKVFHPEAVAFSALYIAVLVISICVKLYMCYYNRTIGRKIDSSAMKATAVDSLSDSVATSVVLLSMLLQPYTRLPLDGLSGLLVSCLIFYAGFQTAKDTLNLLLGQPPEPEFIEEIRNITMSYPEIIGIHDLVVHDYGPGRCMISLHGEVSGDGNIYVLHDVIDQAEKELKEKLGCEAVIHMDPVETNNEVIQELKKTVEMLAKEISDQISIHDFRMVSGQTHTNLIFDAVVPYQVKLSDDEVRKRLQEKISKALPNHFAVVEIDHAFVL